MKTGNLSNRAAAASCVHTQVARLHMPLAAYNDSKTDGMRQLLRRDQSSELEPNISSFFPPYPATAS